MLTEQEVMEALTRTIHPEIDYSLVELGMIKEVGVEGQTVKVTMNLPFPGVPIRDHLAELVKGAVAEKDASATVEVSVATMDEAQREEFRRKAREKWKL
jgi:ATP-binding protein involved in chromosome partitioning